MKTTTTLFLFLILMSCGNRMSNFNIKNFEGTWKLDGKNQYEYWYSDQNGNLVGNSYKLVNEEKVVLETLAIKKIGDLIVYEATVPNQNNGKTIQFILNKANDTVFSFENLKHDFPKKIQYKLIGKDSLKVSVLGDNDEGFSYSQVKQPF